MKVYGRSCNLSLYSTVIIVSSLGYVTQLVKSVKIDSSEGVSISSWVIWSYTWLVSTLYTFFIIEDGLFTAVSVINLVFSLLITIICIRKRNLK